VAFKIQFVRLKFVSLFEVFFKLQTDKRSNCFPRHRSSDGRAADS
jgi:hypothetical protein